MYKTIKVMVMELSLLTKKTFQKQKSNLRLIVTLLLNRSTDCFTEGSLSNTLNEKNSFTKAHNTRGRHSSITMDTVRNMITENFCKMSTVTEKNLTNIFLISGTAWELCYGTRAS